MIKCIKCQKDFEQDLVNSICTECTSKEEAENSQSQGSLFDIPTTWEEEWNSMPEFKQGDLTPHRQIIISFKKEADVVMFAKLIKQNLTPKTKSVWFPKVEFTGVEHLRWDDEK